ncbi:MAG TPA: chromosome segregation protein SMC [Saprospiraceae bacterium]|nr:chromosome segregation protein SMC [Saprospiraceae bacterium]
MIKSIEIENFFSFRKSQKIALNKDSNILIGINGSGKSNFLKAIQLLYEGVVGDGFENIFLKEWSGFSSIANFSKDKVNHIKITYEFDAKIISTLVENKGYRFIQNPIYEITIEKAGSSGYYLKEWIYNKPTNKEEDPFTFLQMENGRGHISTRGKKKVGLQYYPENETGISFKTQELVLRQISDPNRYFPLFTLKNAIEKLVVYSYFDTTLKSPIRQLSSYTVEKKLLPNGENLVQILQRMKNHQTFAYDKIEKLLTDINPMFKDISFDFIGSKSLLVLREKNLNRSVPIEHISDGTLRYLLLLSILYNPDRGGLICIDEPETGLHPDMINTICKAIKHAAHEGTQVIIATHSPLLLNKFELDDIWIFEKNIDNETIVSSKEEKDFEEWENEFLAGQLWLKGKLGGTRWQ